jgi:hypothetical protein
MVRFTLAAEGFEPWLDIVTRYPRWTPEHIKLMKRHARSWGGSHHHWRCRAEPLPLKQWLAFETRTYRGRWRPFDFHNSAEDIPEIRPYLPRRVYRPGEPPHYRFPPVKKESEHDEDV